MPEPGAAVRRRRPAHKQKGDAAFRNNDVRAAERWYAAALEEDSEHPALHYNSAACLERLGRPLDAARCCASALRCCSDYAAARLPRARCLAHGAAADGDRGPNAKAYLVEALAEYTKCPEVGAEQTAVARRLKRCNTEDPAADAAAPSKTDASNASMGARILKLKSRLSAVSCNSFVTFRQLTTRPFPPPH